MFCPRCGTPFTDGAYCPSCGQPLTTPVPPAVSELKKAAASPLFFTAVILSTVSAVLSLLFSIFGSGASLAMAEELLGDLGLGTMTDAGAAGATIGSVIGAFIGLIPQTILLIGLWKVTLSARDPLRPAIDGGGLSLIKGVMTFFLVMMVIAAALIALAVILLVVLASTGVLADSSDDLAAGSIAVAILLAILLPIVVGAFVLLIVFYVKCIRSVNVARNTLYTGIPSSKVSLFVAVWCFISAALSLPSLLSLSFLQVACSIATQILFGMVLIRYREQMQRLERPAPFPQV